MPSAEAVKLIEINKEIIRIQQDLMFFKIDGDCVLNFY